MGWYYHAKWDPCRKRALSATTGLQAATLSYGAAGPMFSVCRGSGLAIDRNLTATSPPNGILLKLISDRVSSSDNCEVRVLSRHQ